MAFFSIFQTWTSVNRPLAKTVPAVLMVSTITLVNVPKDLRASIVKRVRCLIFALSNEK